MVIFLRYLWRHGLYDEDVTTIYDGLHEETLGGIGASIPGTCEYETRLC